ncbi:hypothetical protein FQA39_LY03094 [Lamprigera yunnana]|nr:hypothetical protein FQA39_LY03094 [Lamprigera yunnana]
MDHVNKKKKVEDSDSSVGDGLLRTRRKKNYTPTTQWSSGICGITVTSPSSLVFTCTDFLNAFGQTMCMYFMDVQYIRNKLSMYDKTKLPIETIQTEQYDFNLYAFTKIRRFAKDCYVYFKSRRIENFSCKELLFASYRLFLDNRLYIHLLDILQLLYEVTVEIKKEYQPLSGFLEEFCTNVEYTYSEVCKSKEPILPNTLTNRVYSQPDCGSVIQPSGKLNSTVIKGHSVDVNELFREIKKLSVENPNDLCFSPETKREEEIATPKKNLDVKDWNNHKIHCSSRKLADISTSSCNF